MGEEICHVGYKGDSLVNLETVGANGHNSEVYKPEELKEGC